MFARWRTLAAAAGAFWFPYAIAHASAHRDNFRTDPPATCSGYHDSIRDRDWYRHESECWYDRYYQNSCDETITGVDETNPTEEDSGNGTNSTLGNNDDYRIPSTGDFIEFEETPNAQVIPPISEPGNLLDWDHFDFSDTGAANEQDSASKSQFEANSLVVDELGCCDDLTCPCHDVVDLNDDDDEATDTTFEGAAHLLPSDSLDVETHCLDVYEPYAYDQGNADIVISAPSSAVLGAGLIKADDRTREDGDRFDVVDVEDDRATEYSDFTTSARLTGNIESMDASSDEALFNGLIEDLGEADEESAPDMGTDSGTGDDDQVADEMDEIVESPLGDSDIQAPQFHFFYPGFEWTRYESGNSGDDATLSVQPVGQVSDSYHSAPMPASSYPFQGAAWMLHGAISVVTWTGKLAEQVNNWSNQVGAHTESLASE